MPSETEIMLLRIVQEALYNVRKHSKATEVLLRVEFGRDRVGLCVSDDGVGFELPRNLGELARKEKSGLIGMSERARILCGSFHIKLEIGKGTSIVVEIPG